MSSYSTKHSLINIIRMNSRICSRLIIMWMEKEFHKDMLTTYVPLWVITQISKVITCSNKRGFLTRRYSPLLVFTQFEAGRNVINIVARTHVKIYFLFPSLMPPTTILSLIWCDSLVGWHNNLGVGIISCDNLDPLSVLYDRVGRLRTVDIFPIDFPMKTR